MNSNPLILHTGVRMFAASHDLNIGRTSPSNRRDEFVRVRDYSASSGSWAWCTAEDSADVAARRLLFPQAARREDIGNLSSRLIV